MNHPELITRTLDSHLTQPTRLILYGRAALALGYPAVPAAFHATWTWTQFSLRRKWGRGEADHALPDTPLHSVYSVHSVVKNSSSSTPRHTTDNWARPTTLYFFRTQRRKMHALRRLPDHAQLIAS